MEGVITRETIVEAWTFLKEHASTIPSETIDFMRDAALEKLIELKKSESAHARLMRGRND